MASSVLDVTYLDDSEYRNIQLVQQRAAYLYTQLCNAIGVMQAMALARPFLDYFEAELNLDEVAPYPGLYKKVIQTLPIFPEVHTLDFDSVDFLKVKNGLLKLQSRLLRW